MPRYNKTARRRWKKYQKYLLGEYNNEMVDIAVLVSQILEDKRNIHNPAIHRENDQKTSLYWTVQLDDIVLANILLDNGANPNVKWDEHGPGLSTKFLLDICRSKDMFDLLIKRGANPFDCEKEWVLQYQEAMGMQSRRDKWLLEAQCKKLEAKEQTEDIPTLLEDI